MGYTLKNLKQVDDSAQAFGLSPDLEARFARKPLESKKVAVSYQRLLPNVRIPFGHKHAAQEEIYVVLSGSGQAKVGDETVDLKEWDALRVAPGAWRGVEAGPDGLELLAFGARCGMSSDDSDVEMEQKWWSD